MEQKQTELLKDYGMDIDSTLARFANNEALMMRFLLGFPKDPTMQSLRDAVAAGDREAMKVAAHSLKGLTGNLGLTPLFEASTQLMNTLRQTEDDVTDLYVITADQYDLAVVMLEQLTALS